MVKQIFSLIYVFLILFVADSSAQSHESSMLSNNSGCLHIRITGFKNDKGDCWFALDNSKLIYESKDSVFIGKILPIKDKQVIITIDSLKYDDYAVRVFQDENENGKLDKNIFGIPTEDYGYSNNARSWFGPPSWEKAKFLFNQKEMTIEISVK